MPVLMFLFSDFPQLILYGGAGLLIVVKAIHGWRLGLVRQLAGLLSLAVAISCAAFGGRSLAAGLETFLPYPHPLLVFVGSLLLGVGVYAVLTLTSALLFKKTEHQSWSLVRLAFGLSGAFLGALYGVVLVFIGFVGIRLLGAVAEVQGHAEAAPGRVAKAGSVALGTFAKFKKSIESGPAGAIVERCDPIPAGVYTTLGKMGRVVGDAEAISRFLSYPEVSRLLHEKKVAELMHDPELSAAAAQHRFVTLLTNPRLVAAAKDAEVSAALRQLPFEKALDYALAKPENGQPHPGR